MSSKHTPGPWTHSKGERHDFFYIDSPDGDVVYVTGSLQPDHVEANARLIAAAPELLEALTKKVQDAEQRMFEDWLEFNSPSGDHEAIQRQWLESDDYRGFIGEWREQLDAIAKATGGAQ